MFEQMKTRAVDVLAILAVVLIFWAGYTGYVLMGAVRATYAGQCGIIQERALEEAVMEALKDMEDLGVKE